MHSIVVKLEEINLKFEKVQDEIQFIKVRDAHSITTILSEDTQLHDDLLFSYDTNRSKVTDTPCLGHR